MSAVVEAENLSRFYGVILGLNNVTFALKPARHWQSFQALCWHIRG